MFYGVDLTAKILFTKPTVLHVFLPKLTASKRAIRGIATLGNELFVVRERSSTIQVCHTLDFIDSRHVTVPEMKIPLSLIASSHYNSRYISD